MTSWRGRGIFLLVKLYSGPSEATIPAQYGNTKTHHKRPSSGEVLRYGGDQQRMWITPGPTVSSGLNSYGLGSFAFHSVGVLREGVFSTQYLPYAVASILYTLMNGNFWRSSDGSLRKSHFYRRFICNFGFSLSVLLGFG